MFLGKNDAQPEYIDNQEFPWTARGVLTDWLIEVHVRLYLMPETLILAVNIVDCFLSARVISLAKLSLLGITCLFISSKVEEIGASPPIMHFLHLDCDSISIFKNHIL